MKSVTGKHAVNISKTCPSLSLLSPPPSLPGYDWVLLSPCYVETDDDVAGWRELLGRLGVRDGLIIRKEKQTLTAKDLVRGRTPLQLLPRIWRDYEKKNAITCKPRPRSPVSLHEIRLCLCCVRTQYLAVAWTPEPERELLETHCIANKRGSD